MSNIDVSGHIHLWFTVGFFLLLAQVCIQAIAITYYYTENRRIETLYLILDGVMLFLLVGWLSFGAYWRFSEFGDLCSQDYIVTQGEGMMIFYKFNAIMFFLTLTWCCAGCCAGFWSYYSSLPNTRY